MNHSIIEKSLYFFKSEIFFFFYRYKALQTAQHSARLVGGSRRRGRRGVRPGSHGAPRGRRDGAKRPGLRHGLLGVFRAGPQDPALHETAGSKRRAPPSHSTPPHPPARRHFTGGHHADLHTGPRPTGRGPRGDHRHFRRHAAGWDV